MAIFPDEGPKLNQDSCQPCYHSRYSQRNAPVYRYADPKAVSPWFAVNLAFLFPGIGQIYFGRTGRGMVFLLCAATLIAVFCWTFFSAGGDIKISAATVIALVFLWLWNLLDAYKCASRALALQHDNADIKKADPWLAVFLSLLIPGLGHLYMRKWLGAAVFLAFGGAALTIPAISPFTLTFLNAASALAVCVSTPDRSRSRLKLATIFLVVFILEEVFLMLAPAIMTDRFAQAELTPVAGESMEPALTDGEVMLVSTSKNYAGARGDIVSIRSRKYPEVKIVKRIVALQGESIEIKNGKIYIDGTEVAGRAFDAIRYQDWGRYAVKGRPYRVPQGSFFVLGDNSLVSRDSRLLGAIPRSEVIGKAYKVVWPPSRVGILGPPVQKPR